MFSNYIAELGKALDSLSSTSFDHAISLVRDKVTASKNIFIAGNGGSSATASHVTVDWQKGLGLLLEKQIHVDCLTDNVPLLTAYSNDLSYEVALGKILASKAKSDDLLVLFSGSGKSKNIIFAAQEAKRLGVTVLSLTGFDGGELKPVSDLNVNVPSTNMQIIEDIHGVFGHMVLRSFS